MKTTTIVINAIVFFAAMTVITGFVYPLVVTGFAQAVFPFQANGSIIKDGSAVRGSRLIAQDFSSDNYFHARPSAASYATIPSGASNLSPAGKALADVVAQRKAELNKRHGDRTVPADMLYASASGLDPDISIESALIQAESVSAARGFSQTQKAALVAYIMTNPEARELFPSPARINIMDLNAMLDTEPKFASAIR